MLAPDEAHRLVGVPLLVLRGVRLDKAHDGPPRPVRGGRRQEQGTKGEEPANPAAVAESRRQASGRGGAASTSAISADSASVRSVSPCGPTIAAQPRCVVSVQM